MKTVTKDGNLFAVLYHYVDSCRRMVSITEKKLLMPSVSECKYFMSDRCGMPRVNITDVAPEEGRFAISLATCLNEQNINYGLELLVPVRRLEQVFPHLPRAYQIFVKPEEEGIEVVVIRAWNMSRVENRIGNGGAIFRGNTLVAAYV